MTHERIITDPPRTQGSCSHCGADFDGGGIWQHFYDSKIGEGMSLAAAEVEADRIAEMYGASRHTGRWGLQMAHIINDRASRFSCQNCGHTYDRAGHTVVQGSGPKVGVATERTGE